MAKLTATASVALALLCSGPIQSAAAAELSFVTIEAAPWAYRDAEGKAVGALPEILRELEHRGGDTIALSLYPLARIDRAMETGESDCTVILWNEHRAGHVDRGEDVYAMPFGVVARKGARLESYADLAALTISVTRGLAMNPRFDADTALRKDIDKDYLTGLRKIARGRVDAVAGALPTILHIARRADLESYLGGRLAFGHVPLALQCSKRSPRLDAMARLNAALRTLRADGGLAVILARHGYF